MKKSQGARTEVGAGRKSHGEPWGMNKRKSKEHGRRGALECWGLYIVEGTRWSRTHKGGGRGVGGGASSI